MQTSQWIGLCLLLVIFAFVAFAFKRSLGTKADGGGRRCRRSTISSRTRSVAVAVSAMIGVSGRYSRSVESWRYSGRKSCPHSLMQCASSIATMLTVNVRSRSTKLGCSSRSGAIEGRPSTA